MGAGGGGGAFIKFWSHLWVAGKFIPGIPCMIQGKSNDASLHELHRLGKRRLESMQLCSEFDAPQGQAHQ